jgi:Asp-tRNA(Asn)/Glu-tRNA(Gln) amidotransferase A subunit family amidase
MQRSVPTLPPTMPTFDDPTELDALALSRALHAREVSCRELMQACLARIHRLNPRFNAIVNLAPDDDLLARPTPATPNWRAAVARLDARHAAGHQGHRRTRPASPPPSARRC